MSKPTSITSQSHLNTLLSSTTYVICDFYADWCGPCKAIAPIFEQLCAQHAKKGKMEFVKVDVDRHQDIAGKYGVTAMPTFLVIKSGNVVETIKGANPAAIRSAVQKAANDAGSSTARGSGSSGGASFSSKGYTLGTESSGSRPVNGSNQAVGGIANVLSGLMGAAGSTSSGSGPPAPMVLGTGWADSAVRFAGLYLTTLFSFDAHAAAQASPFRVAGQANTSRR